MQYNAWCARLQEWIMRLRKCPYIVVSASTWANVASPAPSLQKCERGPVKLPCENDSQQMASNYYNKKTMFFMLFNQLHISVCNSIPLLLRWQEITTDQRGMRSDNWTRHKSLCLGMHDTFLLLLLFWAQCMHPHTILSLCPFYSNVTHMRRPLSHSSVLQPMGGWVGA